MCRRALPLVMAMPSAYRCHEEEIMSRLDLLLLLGLLTSSARAQREPQDFPGEIYALASTAGEGKNLEGTSAAGFCLGGAWKPVPRLGLVVDFGRHFMSDTHFSANTLMAGPRVYSGERYRTSGFVQILAGAGRPALAGKPTHWSAVLMAPGAGFDVRLTHRLAWRVGQIDLTLDNGVGLLRLSSGFVLRVGA
jgi:hypothetical protein